MKGSVGALALAAQPETVGVVTQSDLPYAECDGVMCQTAKSQSQAFLTALKQAGFFASALAVPWRGHFWASDSPDEPGGYPAQAAPQMLRFLRTAMQ